MQITKITKNKLKKLKKKLQALRRAGKEPVLNGRDAHWSAQTWQTRGEEWSYKENEKSIQKWWGGDIIDGREPYCEERQEKISSNVEVVGGHTYESTNCGHRRTLDISFADFYIYLHCDTFALFPEDRYCYCNEIDQVLEVFYS